MAWKFKSVGTLIGLFSSIRTYIWLFSFMYTHVRNIYLSRKSRFFSPRPCRFVYLFHVFTTLFFPRIVNGWFDVFYLFIYFLFVVQGFFFNFILFIFLIRFIFTRYIYIYICNRLHCVHSNKL